MADSLRGNGPVPPAVSTQDAHAAVLPAVRGDSASLFDQGQLESLWVNLEASLRVYSRSHFFTWSQGQLQSLIRHEVLICALRGSAPASFRVDGFSTLLPDASRVGELLLRDASVVADLSRTWKQRRFRALGCEVGGSGGPCSGALGRELERIGATRLIAHGSHDADGEVCSFFVFAAAPATVTPSTAHRVELVVPFLHAAWIRSQVHEAREGACVAPAAVALPTAREQEILKWISVGKSNAEVGAILEISPLTVKNHVQKILRKLNVVNRAQAVARALEARMFSP